MASRLSRGIRSFTTLLCLALLPLSGPLAIQDIKYVQFPYCDGMVLSSQHRYQTHTVRSLLHCLVMCRASAACVSVVHDPVVGLCHLGSSSAAKNCSNMEVASAGVRYYEHKVRFLILDLFNNLFVLLIV